MSLYDTKRDLILTTSILPKRYEDYDITELADKYCKALDEQDDENINLYLSALILRFWYVIDKMYQKCKNNGVEREDCFYRLYECINAACYYRAWQNPEKKTNAQACINQVLASRGVPALIYEANLQKNFRAITCLDEELDSESRVTRADLIEDENRIGAYDEPPYQVLELMGNGNLIEAIVADNIAYKDVFKHEEKTIKEVQEDGTIYKYKQHTQSFWPFKVVQELNLLDDKYADYFINKYCISSEKFMAAFNQLKKANNQKKYKYIDHTLKLLKTIMY